MKRNFLKYNPKLKATARMLRKQSTLAEILLWNELKGKKMLGYDFHRQKPIHNYIVDFFSPRLMLAPPPAGTAHRMSIRLKKIRDDSKSWSHSESDS